MEDDSPCYHFPFPYELPGYVEGYVYSDYHPLSKREIEHFLSIVHGSKDAFVISSVQVRFQQAIPGRTYPENQEDDKYRLRLRYLAYIFAHYASKYGPDPLLVQQMYDLTH